MRGLVAVVAGMALLGASAVQQTQAPSVSSAPAHVRLLTIEGVINPLSARYLERELRDAAEAGADLVIIRMDTPGGLESSMRRMTEAIMASPTPVAVFVAPPGARAASAGMFLTIAAHIAVMAPGTNIGAAHPVGMGQGDTVMVGKVVNDAAALARAVAAERGRNAQWAEDAVRQSVSITAAEAVDLRVIDTVAADVPALLQWLDGRTVTTTAGERTLYVAGAEPVEQPMRFAERLLHIITDPNIAYLLFTIAMVGIVAELYNPGLIFPGLTGALSLVLSLVAFGSLPINWAGVFLLALAVGLAIAELNAEGFGVFGIGAIVAFILGSLMLYTPIGTPSPALPDVRVNPGLIVLMSASMAAFFLVVMRSVVRAQKAEAVMGPSALVGRAGVALSDLKPHAGSVGRVRINGEVWTAVSEDDTVHANEPIEVAGVEGVTLKVRRPIV